MARAVPTTSLDCHWTSLAVPYVASTTAKQYQLKSDDVESLLMLSVFLIIAFNKSIGACHA
jgi:hypothetical protein